MTKSITSMKRRKQRKAMFTANSNERRVMMSSHLSKELRATWGFRSFPLRTQDLVVIKTGKFKGKEGRVESVSRSTLRVTVEGCSIIKSTGGTALVPLDPSNLEIKQFYIDEFRKAALERKKATYDKTKAKYSAMVSATN